MEETPAEIRRVALEMFATRGYDATSVRDIAAAVGIRGATMYHHFAAKEEILWDLTQTAILRLANSWAAAKEKLGPADPISRLSAFVRTDVAFHAEHRTEAVIVNAQLHRLSPEHRARAVEMRRALELELTTIVTDCLTTGQHAVPDVRVTVFAILQMTIAVSGWYDPTGPLSVEQIAGIYQDLAVKMLAPGP
ncbi:transcriptional regulator, TetR family [Prauserella aidingensis]|uniref:TetR/AcrR family transcriptional regulator n=1 Tax=Prauserella aidingensis TaxID=387890 RepID=UPI0020A3B7F0|nr:TetR/AcrR family transcriptional regulator [Prauserella aidingensis]MCP2255999.1 transcriptional regulator, TetR family [Prauserella aidingensis]